MSDKPKLSSFWKEEINRRVENLRTGKTKLIDGKAMLERLRKEFKNGN